MGERSRSFVPSVTLAAKSNTPMTGLVTALLVIDQLAEVG